jgi:hypothetical protein
MREEDATSACILRADNVATMLLVQDTLCNSISYSSTKLILMVTSTYLMPQRKASVLHKFNKSNARIVIGRDESEIKLRLRHGSTHNQSQGGKRARDTMVVVSAGSKAMHSRLTYPVVFINSYIAPLRRPTCPEPCCKEVVEQR